MTESIENAPDVVVYTEEQYTTLHEKYEQLLLKVQEKEMEETFEDKPISEYKVGDFVQIKAGRLLDWENGRVIEKQKFGLSVGTVMGEFLIQSPQNIRSQV